MPSAGNVTLSRQARHKSQARARAIKSNNTIFGQGGPMIKCAIGGHPKACRGRIAVLSRRWAWPRPKKNPPQRTTHPLPLRGGNGYDSAVQLAKRSAFVGTRANSVKRPFVI